MSQIKLTNQQASRSARVLLVYSHSIELRVLGENIVGQKTKIVVVESSVGQTTLDGVTSIVFPTASLARCPTLQAVLTRSGSAKPCSLLSPLAQYSPLCSAHKSIRPTTIAQDCI